MPRIATARGYANGRIYERGDTVPDAIPAGKWIAEVDGRKRAASEEQPDERPTDNLETRTSKALKDIAKAEKVTGIETDDNKADLIRKIRAAREAKPEKE